MERGVKSEWFVNDEERAVFDFIMRHWARYNEVPTAVTVKDNFPTFRLLKVEDTSEYLLDQLIAYRRRQDAIRIVQDAAESIEQGDHEAAIAHMSKGVAAIGDEGSVTVREIDITENPMGRYQAYEDLENRGTGMLGLPTGFTTIDEATAGLQPGQLVTIIAPPKTGKSVLALQVGINVHDQGRDVAMQSFEMSNEEQITRHDAMRAHIAHARLVRGALEVAEKTRYRQAMRRLVSMPNAFTFLDSTSGVTVSTLAAKVEILKPHVLIVDGVYLMIDEVTGESNTPQSLTNITRALKRLAQRAGIPVIITTQVLLWKMKGGKVSADSIGYSSSFFQDSDVILGLDRDENDENARILRIVASRNCGPAEVDLVWDWNAGKFEEFVP